MESTTRRMYRMRSKTEVLTEVVSECCCRSHHNRNPAPVLDDASTIKLVFKECMNEAMLPVLDRLEEHLEEMIPVLDQVKRLLVEVCAINRPYYGKQFPGQEDTFASYYAWNPTNARSFSDGCWPTFGKGYEEKTTYGRQRSHPVENQDTESVSIKINSPVNISDNNAVPDETLITNIQDDVCLHQTIAGYGENGPTIGIDKKENDIHDPKDGSGVPCNKPEGERDVGIQTLPDEDKDPLVITLASPVVTSTNLSQQENIFDHDEKAILKKDEPMANLMEDNLDAILNENESVTIPNENNVETIPKVNESITILNENDVETIPKVNESITILNENDLNAIPDDVEQDTFPNEDDSAVPNEDIPRGIVPNNGDAEAIPNDELDTIINEYEVGVIRNEDEMDLVMNEDEQEGITNEDQQEGITNGDQPEEVTDENEPTSMNTMFDSTSSIVQVDSFDSEEPWQRNDVTRKLLLGDLNYHNRLLLERSLDGSWDMLSKLMVDKYVIPVKQFEIDACMYPGCKRIGSSLFECLATMMPDLTVEKFCCVAKNHRRNDISCLLEAHNGELLTDIPLLVRNRLEIICGLSNYTHKEGNWKLFAEELGVDTQSIIEIAQSSFDISNRSQCDEILDLFKSKAPRLSVQDMVESLRELGIHGSADSLEKLISDKENEYQYKTRLTIRSISIRDTQINYAIL